MNHFHSDYMPGDLRRLRMVERARIVVIVLTFFGGCGRGPDYPHATITGVASVNGEPIEQGTISYVSELSGSQRRGTAEIEHGKFKLTEVPIGSTVFTFAASKETGRTIPGPGGVPEAERINLIPRQYGVEGITRDISGDGPQDFDIENTTLLSSAKPPR